MARLSWHGIDASGRRLQGRCQADSPRALRHALAAQGIAVLETHRQLRPLRRRRAAPAERAATLRRLASVVEAGAPLNEALRAVAAQAAHPELRKGLRAIRYALERGTDLATAFQDAYPSFQAVHTALLEAGTWTGDLPGALRHIAADLERRDAILRQLRRAGTYPAVVALLALALTGFLLAFVVPRFEAIFGPSSTELPFLTRAIIAASDAVARLGPLVLGALLALAPLAAVAAQRWPGWRRHAIAMLVRLPTLGDMLREAALSRWCGTLARLLQAGVPLLQALPLAAEAGHGAALEPGLRRLERRVRTGDTFGAALRATVPDADEAAHLVAIGEASGRLEEMLTEAGATYQERLEARLQRLSALLEPALIVLMGLITAGVVAALYLPIFQMGGTL